MDEPAAHVVHEVDRPVERWGEVVSWRTLVGATGDPTNDLVLGTAELAPGAPVDGALHRHEPAEAYFVVAGSGLVHIDGVDHPVTAGSAVFVPGGAWHVVRNTGTETLRLVYVLAADAFADVRYEFPDGAGPPG